MAGEMIAPSTNSYDNQEEKNENEEFPLLINNKKKLKRNKKQINYNRTINIEDTYQQKMNLIFFILLCKYWFIILFWDI